MALKTRSTSKNTKQIDDGSVEVKVELTVEVAHLSLSTPNQQLRRSPRKRTPNGLKEESNADGPPSSGMESRFWSGGPSTSRKRPTKEDSDSDDVLPILSKTGSLRSATATERKQTVAPKRRATKLSGTPSPPKKVKREYAPPETYAHLDYLSDYLQEHLDVMFCGINPGCKSAETGHHFAHVTNHFWRALHLSGFTDRLLRPVEDSTLPTSYNLGLTNLVERPSAEQAELSLLDMQNGVPSLLAKIALYQPRVVCFVGKQIGEVFLKVATSALPPPPAPAEEPSDSPESPTSKGAKKGKKPKKAKAGIQMGFQPYKTVHPAGSVVEETLFYIMPSSSARVIGYQLKEKTKIMETLYDEIQRAKAGRGMQTEDMQVIQFPTIKEEP